MARLFGTDGIRGLANKELTAKLAFEIGRAGARILIKENQVPRILIANDTRLSADMLEAALVAGMCSMGAHVISAGVVPTPAVAYLVRKYEFEAGVMVSASHNSFEDNGIKFFDSNGFKLKDELEDQIEALILENPEFSQTFTGSRIGQKYVARSAMKDYVDYLVSTLNGADLSGLRVALDCANGATYQLAPAVFEKLGATVMAINTSPNGMNINRNCGSTHPQDLLRLVAEAPEAKKYDLAFAFDGDGDRCFAADENGNLIDGDMIMSIIGCHMKENGKLKHNTIVTTIMANLGFFMMAKENGIETVKTKVGDRYVLEEMTKNKFNLGGEQSGHIIFSDYATTGDGILTALQLARIVKIAKSRGEKLSQLNTKMKPMPQVLVGAKIDNKLKKRIMEHETLKTETEKLENKFEGRGRVLVRPSGTEPLIRVMLEGEDLKEITAEAERLKKILENLAVGLA